MEIAGNVLTGWVLWTMLIVGTALSLVGLRHSCERFWHWRQARALYAGEMVPAEAILVKDLEISILPPSEDAVARRDRALPALLTHVDRRTLALNLDTGLSLPTAVRDGGSILPDWLKLGVTVDATFVEKNAHYRFTARVQDVRAAGDIWQLSLSIPRWLERKQRRNHFRVSISNNPGSNNPGSNNPGSNNPGSNNTEPLPATFECAEGYRADSAGSARSFPPQHGTLRDLSVGGLCADLVGGASPARAAQLVEQFAPDSILCVRLPIAALSSQSVLVRVRQCERVIVRGGLGVRIACVFLSMPVWEQDLVAQKVSELQREQLRTKRRA